VPVVLVVLVRRKQLAHDWHEPRDAWRDRVVVRDPAVQDLHAHPRPARAALRRILRVRERAREAPAELGARDRRRRAVLPRSLARGVPARAEERAEVERVARLWERELARVVLGEGGAEREDVLDLGGRERKQGEHEHDRGEHLRADAQLCTGMENRRAKGHTHSGWMAHSAGIEGGS
jgi:hypothetical protein